MADLLFTGGVVKERTAYDVGPGWIDSNLIRSRNGRMAPVGGWFKRQVDALAGVCRCIKEFSNNSGVDLLAFGTNSNVYVLSGDTVYDITPAGFVPGAVDASVADGFGIGPYGDGTYGTPRTPSTDPFAQVILEPLIWSIDNFGEDLVMCPYSGIGSTGPIYIWHSVGGFATKATLLSADPSAQNVPESARGVFVNPLAEQVIAVGCCPFGSRQPDPMQIRWSDIENPYDWNPTAANNAGGQRLSSGSYIVGWLATYQETLFWTDTTVYAMQLTGNSLDYSFLPIGRGLSMISPKAAGTNGSLVMWMDQGSFFAYSGSIQELPCTLKAFLFGDNSTTGDLNRLQSFKVFAAHNHSYSEMWWFYPSIASNEVDSYVIYNYRDNVWHNGRLGRTAWSDSGHLQTPIATDAAGAIYVQEYGVDALEAAMPWELTSGDLCIENGDVFTRLERLIPDFVWNGDVGPYQQLNIDVRVRNSSNQTPRVVKTFTVTPNDNNRGNLDMNIRGRRVSIRIYNNGSIGCSWIIGKTQAQYFPAGRR